MKVDRVWSLLFLVINLGQNLAWNPSSVIDISKNIAVARHVSCISILNSDLQDGSFKKEVTAVAAALQKQWKLTRIVLQKDFDDSRSWEGCSTVLNVLITSLPQARSLFLDVVTKVGTTRHSIFLLFVPSDFNLEEFVGNSALPLYSRILIVLDMKTDVNIKQVWRVGDLYPIRSVDFGFWSMDGGLSCFRLTCSFHSQTDMEGAPFRGSTKDDMPISGLALSEDRKNWRISGYFGEVYYTLADALNCTPVVVNSVDNSTGSEVNGNWNGLIGMLIRNEIDVAVGPMSYQTKVSTVTDFVRPLLRTHFQIFFKQAGTLIEWDAFIKPFAFYVWGLILLWIVVGTYTLNFLYKIGVKNGQENEFYLPEFTKISSFLSFLKALCQQGASLLPNSLSCRALYLTGYITSVILYTAYSGSLISKLTVQVPLRPFDSLETFLKDGSYTLTAIARSTDYTFFSEATNPLLQNIFKKTMAHYPEDELPRGKEEGMSDVCKGHKIALFITFAVTQITASEFRIKEKCPILYLSSPIGTVFLTMGMRKGMPYSRAVQQKLQIMLETGILNRLRQKEWPLEIEKHNEVNLPPAVALKQVAPIYCILLFGNMLAILILVSEIVCASPKGMRTLRILRHETGLNADSVIDTILITIAAVIVLLFFKTIFFDEKDAISS